jgi:hypothetical protein
MSVDGPGSGFCAVVGSSISVLNIRILLHQCCTKGIKKQVPWKKSPQEPAAAKREAAIVPLHTIHGTPCLGSLIIIESSIYDVAVPHAVEPLSVYTS